MKNLSHTVASLPQYKDLKKLSKDYLKCAETLIDYATTYSIIYYMAGFSIELALKAFYSKSVKKGQYPPKPNVCTSLYDHSLVKVASAIAKELSPLGFIVEPIDGDWSSIKDWNNEHKYHDLFGKKDAKNMLKWCKQVHAKLEAIW